MGMMGRVSRFVFLLVCLSKWVMVLTPHWTLSLACVTFVSLVVQLVSMLWVTILFTACLSGKILAWSV